VSSALRALENSWAGLIDFWVMERKKETLEKALRLGALAERVFPESPPHPQRRGGCEAEGRPRWAPSVRRALMAYRQERGGVEGEGR
jgi:hypothetical protein